jgi:cullin 4
VSLFQAIILLLFNESSRLSYNDILTATGMEVKDLNINLQTLANGKVKILTKHPKVRF